MLKKGNFSKDKRFLYIILHLIGHLLLLMKGSGSCIGFVASNCQLEVVGLVLPMGLVLPVGLVRPLVELVGPLVELVGPLVELVGPLVELVGPMVELVGGEVVVGLAQL